MAPSSYVSTYQGDFGGRTRASAMKATRPGPSLISRQGGGGASYSKPLSWSSSPMGQPSTNQGYNKFSPAEWSNSNTYHYNRYLWFLYIFRSINKNLIVLTSLATSQRG